MRHPSGHLRSFSIAALLLLLVTGACKDASETSAGGTSSGRNNEEQAVPATAASVSMQLSDIREDMVVCRYSGDMETHHRELQSRNPETYQSNVDTWNKFKAAGATAGYAAYFATDDKTCEVIFTPPDEREMDEGHLLDHPSFAFSIVMQFPDQATAEAAYNAGLFGQSEMRAKAGEPGESDVDIEAGEATGLGPNSVASNTTFRSNPVREAIWQNGAFNLYVGTDVIVRQESERITAAMNGRIH